MDLRGKKKLWLQDMRKEANNAPRSGIVSGSLGGEMGGWPREWLPER